MGHNRGRVVQNSEGSAFVTTCVETTLHVGIVSHHLTTKLCWWVTTHAQMGDATDGDSCLLSLTLNAASSKQPVDGLCACATSLFQPGKRRISQIIVYRFQKTWARFTTIACLSHGCSGLTDLVGATSESSSFALTTHTRMR